MTAKGLRIAVAVALGPVEWAGSIPTACAPYPYPYPYPASVQRAEGTQ